MNPNTNRPRALMAALVAALALSPALVSAQPPAPAKPGAQAGPFGVLSWRSFARTSSHVRLGPGSGLASRRSSSALCQSGTGTASGVAAMLSQTSSTRRSRSSIGSLSISSRRAVVPE